VFIGVVLIVDFLQRSFCAVLECGGVPTSQLFNLVVGTSSHN
jgi:hypothetical protein